MTLTENSAPPALPATDALPDHPLAVLTAAEIRRVTEVLTSAQALTRSARFVFIELQEPPKHEVLTWRPGTPWDRQAFVVLRERAERTTYEAVVSITRGEVLSWTRVDGVQPPMMGEEFLACEAAVQADPRWQAAMRARGVTDFTLTMVDPWASGYLGPQDDADIRRLARPLTFVRCCPSSLSNFAHTIPCCATRACSPRAAIACECWRPPLDVPPAGHWTAFTRGHTHGVVSRQHWSRSVVDSALVS